jgi:hypothetical protein
MAKSGRERAEGGIKREKAPDRSGSLFHTEAAFPPRLGWWLSFLQME